jgi:hypothetical protein
VLRIEELFREGPPSLSQGQGGAGAGVAGTAGIAGVIGRVSGWWYGECGVDPAMACHSRILLLSKGHCSRNEVIPGI